MKIKSVALILVIAVLTSCNGGTKQEPVVVDCMPVVSPIITDPNSTVITPPVGDSNVVRTDSIVPK